MALSKKEMDDLKPRIDQVVQQVFGYSESALVKASLACLDKGYDQSKTAGMYLICLFCVKVGLTSMTCYS